MCHTINASDFSNKIRHTIEGVKEWAEFVILNLSFIVSRQRVLTILFNGLDSLVNVTWVQPHSDRGDSARLLFVFIHTTQSTNTNKILSTIIHTRKSIRTVVITSL